MRAVEGAGWEGAAVGDGLSHHAARGGRWRGNTGGRHRRRRAAAAGAGEAVPSASGQLRDRGAPVPPALCTLEVIIKADPVCSWWK